MSGLLSPELITVAGGIAGGLLSWQLIDLGSWWPEQLVSFLVGAFPAALLTSVSVDTSDAGKTNIKLVSRSVEMAKQAPVTFGMIVIGMTTCMNIAYMLLLGVEVDTLLAFIPIINANKISIAITWFGVLAGIAFGGIAGWTIEVIEWVVEGFHKDKIPVKPGGRQSHSILDVPKDFVYFAFAVPIAIVETVIHCGKHKTLVPLLMIPLKMSLDQWSRLGDLILDMFSLSIVREAAHDIEEIAHFAGKSYKFFDHLFHNIFDDLSAEDYVSRLQTDTNNFVPFKTNHYPTLDAKPSNYWLKYPLLFQDGDNVPLPKSKS